MIYRETGNFVTNYFKDREIFPMKFDKVVVVLGLLFLFLYVIGLSQLFLCVWLGMVICVYEYGCECVCGCMRMDLTVYGVVCGCR